MVQAADRSAIRTASSYLRISAGLSVITVGEAASFPRLDETLTASLTEEILRPLLGRFLDVGAGGFWSAGKIDKVSENVQRFVPLRINRGLFRVIGCANRIGV